MSFVPVDQVEEVLANVLDSVAVCIQVSRPLGAHVFSIVGSESDGTIGLPAQIEQCVGRSKTILKYKNFIASFV